MSNPIIKIENLTMTYRLSVQKVDNLKEYFVRFLKGSIKYKEFNALSCVSIEIFEGEKVGIIGHNGAGKSTLLKLISGIMKPTLGSIQVRGEIAPLLELGAGFDPDMTGAENIYLNGSILGKSKEFLEDNYNDIVDYADLGEFIDVPVKNYSSGMKARLGFSIATKLDPDILIVDEILGVGDQEFRKKSTKTMEELINSGKTILLVTHNLSQMQELCDRVIWLDKGVVRMDGEAEEICKAYSEYHK